MAAKSGPFRLTPQPSKQLVKPSLSSNSSHFRSRLTKKIAPLTRLDRNQSNAKITLHPLESAVRQAVRQLDSETELSAEEMAEPVIDPFRCFDCNNYEICLNLTAVLDWHSFTCKGCNGMVEPRLIWRAHQEVKKKNELESLCPLPALETINS